VFLVDKKMSFKHHDLPRNSPQLHHDLPSKKNTKKHKNPRKNHSPPRKLFF
jgi:hypothetical protein